MVNKSEKEGKVWYQCGECGFHYEDKETAKKCETWCSKNHSCNLDIIKDSLESKSAFNR